MRQERLHVFFVFILVAWARGGIQRPAVFHVVHDGDLRLDFGAVYVAALVHALKLSADGLHVLKYTGVLVRDGVEHAAMADMVDDRAVELFAGAAAFSELEILHGI